MKKASLLFTLLVGCSAATDPKPIPSTRFEEISRKMLALQAARISLGEAKEKFDAADRDWNTLFAALQKEFNAMSCKGITMEKVWLDCGTTPAAPAPAPVTKK